jgi:cobalamin biosynthesis protein CobT
MVELVVIGIKTAAVKKFYKNTFVVNNLKDLPTVCLSELDRLLRQGKRESDKKSKKKAT